MAAFIAIVQGAGGKVTGAMGQSAMAAGHAISTNSILHAEVLNFLS
jgi:fructose-1,6-bisphosphatase/inositol monophosphatase family enzyme